MNELDLSVLEYDKSIGYFKLPLPSRRDDEIGHLVRSYMDLPTTQKQAVVATLKEEDALRHACLSERLSIQMPALVHAQLLEAFSTRMAELAVRRHDPAPLPLGLVALTLAAAAETDIREIWLRLPLHYRSARKVGADPRQVFEQAAAGALPEGQELLRSFFDRTEENRQIEVMGYEESADEGGFRYQQRPRY